MRWRRHFAKIRALFRRSKPVDDLAEEIRTHLEMEEQENVESGMTPEEAHYAALRRFGNVTLVQERSREMWGWTWLETLWQDVRYGARQLRRSPGFTLAAVLTLALGIGANTAIFSVVNAVLLRPLPYENSGRLVWAAERFGLTVAAPGVLGPDFIAWIKYNRVFKQIGAFGVDQDANLTGAGEPERVTAVDVSPSLFPMLGVGPILGRTFTQEEDQRGIDRVVLLSESLWRTRFGGSRTVLGKVIHLDNEPYTVVGVMPGNLQYPSADIWTPMALDDPGFSVNSRFWKIPTVIGRLRPGVTVAQAEADLLIITRRMDGEWAARGEGERKDERVEVVPLRRYFVRDVSTLLLVLLGAVGFVLLIACANVANLLLSRGVTRGREFALRAALGAGRERLIRQLLTESLALAMMGSALGFFAGLWTVRLLRRLIPPTLPSETSLDPRVLGFAIGMALIAVILFCLAPALISTRRDVIEALKAARVNAGTGGGSQLLRNLLVVGEVGLSIILLIGAGLLARSFLRLSDVNPGFDPRHLLLADVLRPVTPFAVASSQTAFFQEALEKIQTLPGVERAALTTHYPLSLFHSLMGRQGSPGVQRPSQAVYVTSVSPDYFRAVRIPLLGGRVFNALDTNGAPNVAILNQAEAQDHFNGRDPIGQQLGPWTVVGVVGNTKSYSLEEEPWLEIFVPYTQPPPRRFMTFVVRTEGDPLALATSIQKAVQSVDKDQAVSNIQTMDQVIAKSVAPQRFRMVLLGLFAMLALALAAIGIFGVMAFSVSQRVHEIGIRMALGAQNSDVLRMIAGQGFKLAMIGVIIGIGGALALTRFLASLLYGAKPFDPLTFVAVSLILIGVALLACYIPARRAMKVDPIVALRYE